MKSATTCSCTHCFKYINFTCKVQGFCTAVGHYITAHDISNTAPQHLICRVVQSLHTNHMQMSIIEVFIRRRLHMNTSMIPVCILLICRLCTALHIKCCGAVQCVVPLTLINILDSMQVLCPYIPCQYLIPVKDKK